MRRRIGITSSGKLGGGGGTPLTEYTFNAAVFTGNGAGEELYTGGTDNPEGVSFWFKGNSADAGSQYIAMENGWGNGNGWDLLIDGFNGNVLRVDAFSPGGFAVWEVPSIDIMDDTWRMITINRNLTSTPQIWYDGVAQTVNVVSGASLPADAGAGETLYIGYDNFATYLKGTMGMVALGGGFNQSQVDNLYAIGSTNGSGKPICYDELGVATQGAINHFYNIGNWTGTAGDEKTDQAGSTDLTSTSEPAYTGTGLNSQCT